MKAHSEAFSVYNMLRYSKRTMCKALNEKILHILIAGKLFKDAYVVVKDNAEHISQPAIKKFASAFMKFGNINLINDVLKVIHGSGYKTDQVISLYRCVKHQCRTWVIMNNEESEQHRFLSTIRPSPTSMELEQYLLILIQGLFQTAVSRYIAHPEKKELLLQLLQWMPGQGYAVDSTTRNLILKNSELLGRQLTAEILSKQHIMSKGSQSKR
ncbi:hypothetical protein Gotur_028872 [Gossypium turneri]